MDCADFCAANARFPLAAFCIVQLTNAATLQCHSAEAAIPPLLVEMEDFAFSVRRYGFPEPTLPPFHFQFSHVIFPQSLPLIHSGRQSPTGPISGWDLGIGPHVGLRSPVLGLGTWREFRQGWKTGVSSGVLPHSPLRTAQRLNVR